MQVSELSRDTLRRLAELRPEKGKVVSFYVNLDPSEFATPKARSSEIRSLVDEGEKRVKAMDDGLSHEDKVALRADIEEVGRYLDGVDFSAAGAHGAAVFRSSPAGLFEVLRLPRPIDSRVFIDDSPLVEPLADLVSAGNWAVLLASRRTGRLLRGSATRLFEDRRFRDEVAGNRDEGNQARDQHAADAEIKDHWKLIADALHSRTVRRPPDRLLIGCAAEVFPDIQAILPSDLSERIVGRFDVDVERTSPSDVLQAAGPLIEQEDRRREREALDRLVEGLGAGGRGAAGLDEVLRALYERRVEVLLFEEGFSAPGVVCPSCGFVGASGGACPVDGTQLEEREDIIETAVELAVTQSAEVIVVHHHDDLSRHDSIGAVLRF